MASWTESIEDLTKRPMISISPVRNNSPNGNRTNLDQIALNNALPSPTLYPTREEANSKNHILNTTLGTTNRPFHGSDTSSTVSDELEQTIETSENEESIPNPVESNPIASRTRGQTARK